MTSTSTPHREPGIPAAVARVRAELGETTSTPAWSLTTGQTRHVLVELAAAEAQLVALRSRVIAHAVETGAAEETGARSTAAWLANATRQTRAETHRQVRLAQALIAHTSTSEAMADGGLHAEQATVITAAVEVLPEEHQAQCEKQLVDYAAEFDAKDLRQLGRRVLDVVDPEAADAHDAAVLEKQEREADKQTSLSMRQDPTTGAWTIKATVSKLIGHMLRTALLAGAAPKHVRARDGAGAYDWTKPTAEKLGEAFCEYVSRYPKGRLPQAGGISATVVVTITHDTLLGGLKSAGLADDALSPAAARLLACEAGIIPAVLGGKSEVLDLGRSKRFHNQAQRIVLGLQQGHCQTTGCDVPAMLCHVHHDEPWSRGGKTNTVTASLRCPRHHALLHALEQAHGRRHQPMRT